MLYASELNKRVNLPEFLGCFPINCMPVIPPLPSVCFILNLDKCSDAGSHWVTIYIKNEENRIIFGDSLNLDGLNKVVKTLIKKFGGSIETIPYRIQHYNSTSCGQFCVFILHHLKKYNHSLSDLVHRNFSETDLHYNESVVLNFWKNLRPTRK